MSESAEDRIVRGLEEFANALERGEQIEERFTCRKVVLDLHPTQYDSESVKEVRLLLGMSQALFAQFLGASPSCVRGWEQGQRKPDSMACRFLDEIRKNPQYWRERFAEIARPKATA